MLQIIFRLIVLLQKKIADYNYDVNVTDVDGLEKICKEKGIDGVLTAYLDVTQIPYVKLCKRMRYFCFGDESQFDILTNKISFKGFCAENNADIIKGYSVEDIFTDRVKYPIIIKPSDSCGSRGQTMPTLIF